MEIRELSVPGAFAMTPKILGDSRGAFLEWFRADRFSEVTGHPFTIAQANCSVSAAGTVRGVHFAEVPPSQAKYVTCPSGALLDVVVDVRRGSPTFGQWEGFDLSDENMHLLYAPVGFAHGFCVLSDTADVLYKQDAYYEPDVDRAFRYDDPDVAIAWPLPAGELVPSQRDLDAPLLRDVANGLPFEYR